MGNLEERGLFHNAKAARTWSVSTISPAYDMNTQKPTITVSVIGGVLTVKGQKPGFTSLSIDVRVGGTTPWITIGVKLTHLPFYDTIAPQTPGKTEKREYRGRGYARRRGDGPAERHRHGHLSRLTRRGKRPQQHGSLGTIRGLPGSLFGRPARRVIRKTVRL